MTTRPNEDDYQRIVWGQPDAPGWDSQSGAAVPVTPASGPQPGRAPETLDGPAVPVTPASSRQAASGQLEAASGPPGPTPADRAWTCRWCGRHHAAYHGDRSPWPDQETFEMVSRDVRQWRPVADYPAEAVYTMRDRYALILATTMAYGWPEDRKLLQAFRLTDAWCRCLVTRPARWWKCRDGSDG